LLSSYGVAMGFAGHAQTYQRWLKPNNGSLYTYLTGGGGATPERINLCSAFDAYAAGWSDSSGTGSACNATVPASRARVFHFLLVRVDGTFVTVTPIDSQGRIFDRQVCNFPGGLVTLSQWRCLPVILR
jgi:hypothetical protein